jgi:hypothetical protein
MLTVVASTGVLPAPLAAEMQSNMDSLLALWSRDSVQMLQAWKQQEVDQAVAP